MHLNSFIGFQSSDTCGKIHYYVRTNWFFFDSCYLHLCSVNDWNVHCVVNGDILPLFISQALYYTGNSNADLAAAWVIENQHRSNIDAPLNVSRVIVKCWCLLLYQSYRIKKTMFLASQFQLLYTSTSILQQHQTGMIKAFIFKKEFSIKDNT